MKPILRFLRPILTVLALALPIVGFVSLAHAADASTAADPTSTIANLYSYITTGKGTAALGAALTLIVFVLRHYALGSWIPWFKTKVGGYVLNFGTPLLAYLATGLSSGAPFSVSLLINALGAGWVAAGAWEHLSDLLGIGTSSSSGSGNTASQSGSTPPATPSIVKRVALAMLCSLLIVDTVSGCATVKKDVTAVGAAIVDCTKGNLADLVPMVVLFFPLIVGGTLDVAAVESAALKLGGDEGGCLLADLKDLLPSASSSVGSAGQVSSATSNAPLALKREPMSLDDYRAKAKTSAKYKTARATY